MEFTMLQCVEGYVQVYGTSQERESEGVVDSDLCTKQWC